MWQYGLYPVKMEITDDCGHFYQLQLMMEDIAIPHPPQCAHWGTFPSGEGFHPAKLQFVLQ